MILFTLDEGLSNELKIQFINEMIPLHQLSTISTSDKIQNHKINIMMCDNENLKIVLQKINKENVEIISDNDTDTIIVMD